MPPAIWSFVKAARDINTDPVTAADYFQLQWENPSDILSILLLLGPEIVQGAVAQLAGRRITPVAFSFGWVAYAARALLAAVGDGSLMPDADMVNTLVIGAQSGHIRTTKTWILGRLLRDGDNLVDDEMISREEAHVAPDTPVRLPTVDTSVNKAKQPMREWEALRISVFEVIEGARHGIPNRDWVFYLGCSVIFVQLIIAIVPWIVKGDWGPFMITSCGNFLALIEGSLPQWRREKWATPRKGGATVTITQGNGSRHAMVILGKKGVGLDLEILAQGTRTAHASRLTRISTSVLAILWIALLGTVAGLKIDTWYLLGIGLLGSIQNVVAAGAARTPPAMGFHLNQIDTIKGKSVAKVLREAEEKFPLVGTSLVPVFFPGSMRVKEEEIEFWREALEKRSKPNQWGTRIDNLPPRKTEADGDKKGVRESTVELF